MITVLANLSFLCIYQNVTSARIYKSFNIFLTLQDFQKSAYFRTFEDKPASDFENNEECATRPQGSSTTAPKAARRSSVYAASG